VLLLLLLLLLLFAGVAALVFFCPIDVDVVFIGAYCSSTENTEKNADKV